MKAQLFVVGTPIGNLEDITLRAIRTLQEVPIIACENIPRTRTLLSYLGIKNKKLLECSPANEVNSAKGIINFLQQGQNIALVSDAGSPCISDPGLKVVHEASVAGYEVVPIPGPSALSTMLSVAGISGDIIIFLGFLSKKEAQIQKILVQYAKKNTIIVIFISCHRIKKFLKMLKDLQISAEISLGKELTKIYEHIYRGSPEEIEAQLSEKEKGEFVAVMKFDGEIILPETVQPFSKKEKRKLKNIQKI